MYNDITDNIICIPNSNAWKSISVCFSHHSMLSPMSPQGMSFMNSYKRKISKQKK